MNFALETLRSSDSIESYAANVIFNRFIYSKDDNTKVQFVLDSSVIKEVITPEQKITRTLNLILSITTTWCYSLNKSRTRLQRN